MPLSTPHKHTHTYQENVIETLFIFRLFASLTTFRFIYVFLWDLLFIISFIYIIISHINSINRNTCFCRFFKIFIITFSSIATKNVIKTWMAIIIGINIVISRRLHSLRYFLCNLSNLRDKPALASLYFANQETQLSNSKNLFSKTNQDSVFGTLLETKKCLI